MEQIIGFPGLTPFAAPDPLTPFPFRERENQDLTLLLTPQPLQAQQPKKISPPSSKKVSAMAS